MKESLSIVKSLFRSYYMHASLELPLDFYVREFAIQPIGLSTYIRHLSFVSMSELRQYITTNVPLHLYYSSARYREPANTTMSEKGWMGSDLVFDIDADHLPKCTERIEVRYCPACGYVTDSSEVKICPQCGNKMQQFDHVEPSCIDVAKDEVSKLIDVIEQDFGYTNIRLAFSGHRGFHVVVELPDDEATMPSDARREIVDYLKLSYVNVEELKIRAVKRGKRKLLTLPPRVSDGGVRRRIAKIVAGKIVYTPLREFVLGHRQFIDMHTLAKFSEEINRIIDEAVAGAAVNVDEKVTIDISRLVRVPKSINGKSGWIVVPLKDLDVSMFEMDPGILSPFPDVKLVVVFSIDVPELTVLDRRLRFKRGDTAVLEAAYALYFVLKGVAKLVGIKR